MTPPEDRYIISIQIDPINQYQYDQVQSDLHTILYARIGITRPLEYDDQRDRREPCPQWLIP